MARTKLPSPALLVVVSVLAGVLALLSPLLTAPAAAGTEPETLVQGTLTAELDGERSPVEGVVIVVSQDGTAVGEATSGADGKWSVVLPGGGTYEVTIDTETLPEGAGLRGDDGATRTVEVDAGRQRGVVFQLGERADAGPSEAERAVNLAVDGLKLGFVIALAAVGLSLIFAVTGLINFAHGELVTFGALVVWYLNSAESFVAIALIPAAIVAVLLGAVVGGVTEIGLFRPLRRRRTGNVALIVVTIGIGLAIRNVYLIFFGGNAKPYRDYALQTPLELGPISITPKDLTIIVLGALVMVGVALLLQRTRMGTAMRAVADNRDLASASGIDVERVILVTWVAGAALAALGGVMLGLTERVSVDMGERMLLLMFAAVVLGGLGRPFGALVGALVIGVATQMSTLFVSTEFKLVVAFGLLILVLLVRPQGILGRAERVG